jgi:hypothetical protein
MPTEYDLIEPSDGELLQEEYEKPEAVRVCIDGPTQTRELPAKFAGMSTLKGVTSGPAVQLLYKDFRRKSATINALSANIILGSSQAQASANSGATWPANVPLVVTSYEEVWVCAVSTTTDISVILESWAD